MSNIQQDMIKEGHATLYLVEDKENGDMVSDWPGHYKVRCAVFEGKHNWWHVKQLYAYFYGPDGKPWYGRCVTGGYTEIIRCRRIKRFNPYVSMFMNDYRPEEVQ